MAIQRTLSIIKPDATRRNLTGAINKKLEKAGLRIIAQKRIKLSQNQAEKFYAVHKDKSFFVDVLIFRFFMLYAFIWYISNISLF